MRSLPLMMAVFLERPASILASTRVLTLYFSAITAHSPCPMGASLAPRRQNRTLPSARRKTGALLITFDRTPETYRHWKMTVDGRVATLALDVDEDAPLVPGYRLKLNSYDLGVDIELNDALQRIRFEHPA